MAKISVWKSLEAFDFQSGECISKNKVSSDTVFFEDTDTLADVCKHLPMILRGAYKISSSKLEMDSPIKFDPDEIVL